MEELGVLVSAVPVSQGELLRGGWGPGLCSACEWGRLGGGGGPGLSSVSRGAGL